ERRAEKVVLAVVARGAPRSPPQRISPSKESRSAPNGNPKPQEKPQAHPAFLQKQIISQGKSSRTINHFRILHGRLFILRPGSWRAHTRPRPTSDPSRCINRAYVKSTVQELESHRPARLEPMPIWDSRACWSRRAAGSELYCGLLDM